MPAQVRKRIVTKIQNIAGNIAVILMFFVLIWGTIGLVLAVATANDIEVNVPSLDDNRTAL